jgi:hypothetical protein
MARATVCVAVDSEEEVQAAEAWFTKWRDRLDAVSGDSGCGCCVHMWDVEGPPEAIAEIPDSISADSPWTRHETNMHGLPERFGMRSKDIAPGWRIGYAIWFIGFWWPIILGIGLILLAIASLVYNLITDS